MMLIHKRDVPEYLIGSPLFENAFQDDTDSEPSIEIPADCFKLDTAVQSESDLRALLQTVRFWLVPEYIESCRDVFSFVSRDKDCLQRLADEFSQDFPFLSKLHSAMQPTVHFTVMGNAVKLGLLGFIQYLRAHGSGWDTRQHDFTSLAAAHGHIHCLQYAVAIGHRIDNIACFLAARGGHLQCLKYTHKHGCKISAGVFDAAVEGGNVDCVTFAAENRNFTLTTVTTHGLCSKAAKEGNIEVLQYLCSIGCQYHLGSFSAAVTNNSLECVQYLHALGCPFNADTAHVAVRCGSLACLQYLHENGCPWDDHVLRNDNMLTLTIAGSSAKSAYMDKVYSCCMYAIEHGCPVTPETYELAVIIDAVDLVQHLHQRGVQWKGGIAYAAAVKCRLDCLKYLLDHGCGCDRTAYISAIRYNKLDIVDCLYTHGIECAAFNASVAVESKNLVILRYLLEHGCPTSPDICVIAARNKEQECLQCLHENGLPLSEDVVAAACKAGSVCCLRYALSQGCQYSTDACVLAATAGYADCLQCLHEHGAPLSQAVLEDALATSKFFSAVYVLKHGYSDWGTKVCAIAGARKGYQNLQYVHESGVEWDISTCISAIQNGSFECLKYAVKSGCPVDASLPAEAARRGRRDMLKWLHKKGCPWDERTTAAAIKADSVECLKYALSWHCPYDVDVNILVESPQCLKYLEKRTRRRKRDILRVC